MPMYDFQCSNCEHIFEDLTETSKTAVNCPICSAASTVIFLSSPPVLTHIIPSYPGCLKQKAGYVHIHGDKPATRLQSGYGGCTKPSTP